MPHLEPFGLNLDVGYILSGIIYCHRPSYTHVTWASWQVLSCQNPSYWNTWYFDLYYSVSISMKNITSFPPLQLARLHTFAFFVQIFECAWACVLWYFWLFVVGRERWTWNAGVPSGHRRWRSEWRRGRHRWPCCEHLPHASTNPTSSLSQNSTH